MNVFLTTPTGDRFGPFLTIGNATAFARATWSGFIIGDRDEDPNCIEMEVIRTAKKAVKRYRRTIVLKPSFV